MSDQAKAKLIVENAVKIADLERQLEEHRRTIRMLTITIDELRTPLNGSDQWHYLYDRATELLNKLIAEDKI
jgi:iron-sulfur cluster repair protein YtfE (RIC family)